MLAGCFLSIQENSPTPALNCTILEKSAEGCVRLILFFFQFRITENKTSEDTVVYKCYKKTTYKEIFAPLAVEACDIQGRRPDWWLECLVSVPSFGFDVDE